METREFLCKKSCRIPKFTLVKATPVPSGNIRVEWGDEVGYIPKQMFDEYFYTHREFRKMKLQKLQKLWNTK